MMNVLQNKCEKSMFGSMHRPKNLSGRPIFTKDQMFRDMLEGIIAEIPEEEIQTVRVIECSTGKEKKAKDEELPGEPLVIKTK